MRCFMSLWPSQKGLPMWSYVIILVLLLLPELSSLIIFSAAAIWLTFDGYRIIWVDCGCFCRDIFCTPLIIASTSRFCSGLTLLVMTELDVLLVYLFLVSRSFTACSLAGSFSIRRWLSQMSRDHYYFPYHLMGSLMSTPFSPWFIFSLPWTPQPPRIPLLRIPLTSNRPLLPPLPPIPADLTCRIRTNLPDDVWVAGKRRYIPVDGYVEAVSKIALWIDLQMSTSVFKSWFGQLMWSKSCLTFYSPYSRTL